MADDDAFLNELQRTIATRMEEYRSSPNNELNRNRKIEDIRLYLTEYANRAAIFTFRRFAVFIGYCTDEVLDIQDSQLTVDVMQTLINIHHNRRFVFSCLPGVATLKVVLKHANDRRFDFWGIRRGIGELSELCNPVVDCFNSNHLSNNLCLKVRRFLKYGFRYSYTIPIYEEFCLEFQHRSYGVYSPRHPNGIVPMKDAKKNPFRMMLIVDTFSVFSTHVPLEDNGDKISSLIYLYRSIPDPYVTPSELFEQLGSVVGDAFALHLFNTYICYLRYRRSPNSLFDQVGLISQPRKLMHLCRCSIRYALADNLNLPDGIGHLGLPNWFVEYLKLKR